MRRREDVFSSEEEGIVKRFVEQRNGRDCDLKVERERKERSF